MFGFPAQINFTIHRHESSINSKYLVKYNLLPICKAMKYEYLHSEYNH